MQICRNWLHFFPTTLNPREEKHLEVAEIEPGELAPQANALSITKRPLGLLFYLLEYFKQESLTSLILRLVK